jgi:hypothetical protein
MGTWVTVGARARLLRVADWLVHDLPIIEREEILNQVGKYVYIQEIDKWGGVWVGFGSTSESSQSNESTYRGHSFLVEMSDIEQV